MVIEIDFNSDEAIYVQLMNQIIMGIATSRLQEGDPLPSVRQLADTVGINMHTVNKAYSLLRQEGFVTIDRRRGAIIAVDVDKIKALEENGIGRPSTYAPTITTITSRQYVEREGKQLKPTVLGEVTTDLMKEHFQNIVDAKFTAKMESDLDDVERGEKDWVCALDDFYKDFSKTLATAEEKMEGKRVKVPDEETDVVCEQCGRNMVIKIGRFGRFLACPGFPECKNTKKIVQETSGNCPLCGERMVQKKSKRGRNFYGCSRYPDCNFMTWNLPVEEKCPNCGSTLFQKGGKAGKLICEKPGCGYERPVGEEKHGE